MTRTAHVSGFPAFRKPANMRVLWLALAAAVLVIASLAIVLAAAGSAAADTDPCGTVTTKADGTNWACSYVDNFDGKSLDSSKWIVQQTAATGFRSGLTCFTNSSKNIQVARGELKLTAATRRARSSVSPRTATSPPNTPAA